MLCVHVRFLLCLFYHLNADSFLLFPLRIFSRPTHSELFLSAFFIPCFLVFKYFQQCVLFWKRALVKKLKYTDIKLYSIPKLLTTCQNFHCFKSPGQGNWLVRSPPLHFSDRPGAAATRRCVDKISFVYYCALIEI